MNAQEVMTRSPSCCLPYVSARLAAGMLARSQVGILPVVEDLFTRKLIGVVTDRDLCIRVLATRNDPDAMAVGDCMTKQPVCCAAEDDVRRVLVLMGIAGVRRIPVVDQNNRLQGIVSIDDLVRHDALSPKEICDALGRITAPAPQVRATASGI